MNVPTMTIGGGEKPVDTTELDKLRAENRELQAMVKELDRKLDDARAMNELTYMRGRCDGLEFSIRCNGVSGNEVAKA